MRISSVLLHWYFHQNILFTYNSNLRYFQIQLMFHHLPHLSLQNGVPAALYMSWLEFLSRDVPEKRKDTLQVPPVLFVRGNQTSVLTYYS